jgi:hypothetical protein
MNITSVCYMSNVLHNQSCHMHFSSCLFIFYLWPETHNTTQNPNGIARIRWYILLWVVRSMQQHTTVVRVISTYTTVFFPSSGKLIVEAECHNAPPPKSSIGLPKEYMN